MKNSVFVKKIFSFLVLIFISAIVSITAHAAQIGSPVSSVVVSQESFAEDTEDCGFSPASPCRTIQHAVYRIGLGGTITVFPGRYHENILVGKANITIASTSGRNSTAVDGRNATDDTVSEAMRIIADGVTIGRRNSSRNGFAFVDSVASGLFNVGSNVTISGNSAYNNGARGFQFGLSTIDDTLDNSSKDIPDDPLNGATAVTDDAALQTQSNITVSENAAFENAMGGYYFSAFDDSIVHNNDAHSNRRIFNSLGMGSGFWIDSGSNRVRLEQNITFGNATDGIFYRRGFGAEPAGLVTDQIAIRNNIRSNGRHGIIFMGDNVVAQYNVSGGNQRDGFHFMGFDRILDVSYNLLVANSGAGLGFSDFFASPSTEVLPLNFDFNGNPVPLGGIHHNNFIDNSSHSFAALGTAFTRCAIATVLDNDSVIEMSHNYWGGNQNICDLTGSTVVQFTPATAPNQVGPFL